VITLPSSVLEHYDENAEKLFKRIQKIAGRTEKIYEPVEEDEIEDVIRTRLFQEINESKAKKIVDDFVSYARTEGLLSRDESVVYRAKFLKSYPFKPEVVDILYKRWGSFPTFQRTRGVLRLLSLVVHDLLDKNIPFIRLGDFNLRNEEIKTELIKHIGSEWDSILAQDITAPDSRSKEVDKGLPPAYKAYRLGTVVSTTIFMMSFSGRGGKGATVKEIKLSTVYPEFSSEIIESVIFNLKERLFYIADEGLYFTNQPTLRRIILTREENVTDEEAIAEEQRVLHLSISKSKPAPFKVCIWPKFSKDIPDTPDLKLIILDKTEPERDFLERCGENPRIYRNTLIFLCPVESQREDLWAFLKKLIALKSIQSDETLHLTEVQKREVAAKIKTYDSRMYEELRKCYRKVYLPSRNGFKMIDLGLTTIGERFLDVELLAILKGEGEILERLSAGIIKEKYLKDKDYIETKKLYEAFLKVPGEIRLISPEGLQDGIKEGVERGIFGLGYLRDEQPVCEHINQVPPVDLRDDEIIVKPELCVEKGEGVEVISPEGEGRLIEPRDEAPAGVKADTYSKVVLDLNVPIGHVSTVAKIINFLKSKFSRCGVKIRIIAEGGEIATADYEDKIKEALSQAGIDIEREEKA